MRENEGAKDQKRDEADRRTSQVSSAEQTQVLIPLKF